jgi:hypothetical protein
LAELWKVDHETSTSVTHSTNYPDGGYGTRVIETAAVKNGTYGLRITPDGSSTAELCERAFTWSTGTGDLRIGCWFNLNSATRISGSGDAWDRIPFHTNPFELGLRLHWSTGNIYEFEVECKDDGNVWRRSATKYTFDATDGWHTIEIHVQRASTNSAADGFIKLYDNGTEVLSRTGIDLYDRAVPTEIRVGKTDNEDLYIGPFWIDDVIARDDATQIYPGGVDVEYENATASATGAASGSITLDPGLFSGTASATGATSGALYDVERSYTGTASATGASAGSHHAERSYTGTATATGAGAGSHDVERTFSGTSTATGAASGGHDVERAYVGAASATGAASGQHVAERSYEPAAASATGAATGQQDVERTFSGTATATGAASGEFSADTFFESATATATGAASGEYFHIQAEADGYDRLIQAVGTSAALTTQAGLVSSKGLQIDHDGASAGVVYAVKHDCDLEDSDDFRMRIHIDPNGMVLPVNTPFQFLQAVDPHDDTQRWGMEIRWTGSEYQVRGTINGDATWVSSYIALLDGPQHVEMWGTRGPTGAVGIERNNGAVSDTSTLDFQTPTAPMVYRFGITSAAVNTTAIQFYLDEFLLTDDAATRIGPALQVDPEYTGTASATSAASGQFGVDVIYAGRSITEILPVASVATPNDWLVVGGGTKEQAVQAEGGGHIRGVNINTEQWFTLGSGSFIKPVAISDFKIHYRIRSVGGAIAAQLRVRLAGSGIVEQSDNIPVTASYVDGTSVVFKHPTGGKWGHEDIENLEIGLKVIDATGGENGVEVDRLYAEYVFSAVGVDASVAGDLSVERTFSGTATATGAASGSTTMSAGFVGTAAAVGFSFGAIIATYVFQGTAAATGAVAGEAAVQRDYVPGTVSATGAASGEFVISTVSFEGTATATGATSGQYNTELVYAGTAAATSAASGEASIVGTPDYAGTASAVGAAAGQHVVEHAFTATATSAGAASGQFVCERAFTGTAAVMGNVTANPLAIELSYTGTASAVGAAAGAFSTTATFEGVTVGAWDMPAKQSDWALPEAIGADWAL